MEKIRGVTESIKKEIAASQHFECANKPGSKLKGIENYTCPLWDKKNYAGRFDEAGYEIDHIEEFCLNGNDDIENLQALCVSCHKYKQKYSTEKQKK